MRALVCHGDRRLREEIRRVLLEIDAAAQVVELCRLEQKFVDEIEPGDLDLIVLDSHLTFGPGRLALRALRAARPSSPVVLVSSTVATWEISAAFATGVVGVIPASAPPSTMLGAFKLVLAGGIYMPTGA